MDTSKLAKLADEYRPTMDPEVLQAWAKDVKRAIGPRVGDVYTVHPDAPRLAGQTVTVMQTDDHTAWVLPGRVMFEGLHQRYLVGEDGTQPWQ